MESKADSAIFNAGAGNQWSKLDFTHDTSNGTAITYQVRCASSSGGLSSATYETIANSGDAIVTKGQFAQIKVTMEDADSGQYTPILQDMELTSESAPTPSGTTGYFR
jgi:hypothetical protein